MTQHTQPHTSLSVAAVAPLCTLVCSDPAAASAIGTAPGEQQHSSVLQHSAELSSWEHCRDTAGECCQSPNPTEEHPVGLSSH